MAESIALLLESVSKRYAAGGQVVDALRDVSLTVPTGELVALLGPSGSGKSTLLALAAGLDAPTSGRVTVLGERMSDLSDDARCDLRLRRIGIVFQACNLLPSLTVAQNVALPLELNGTRTREALGRAIEVLERLGIASAAHARPPAELSGGEQQRVALARALIAGPDVLLADEPTGSLDSPTGLRVLDLVRELNRARQLTVVIATHSAQAAAYAHRVVELRDGMLVRSEPVPQPG